MASAEVRQEREQKFIKLMAHTGNATQSAIDSGYKPKTARQQGYLLKHKYQQEIMDKREHDFMPIIPKAIEVLIELLDCKNPRIRLDTATYILKVNGFGKSLEQRRKEQSYINEMDRNDSFNLDFLD